jgi:hypothetical protein
MNLSIIAVLVLARLLAAYALLLDRLGRLFDWALLVGHSVGLYAVIVNGRTRGIWDSQADGCLLYCLGAAGLGYCIVRRVVIMVRLHAAERGPSHAS